LDSFLLQPSATALAEQAGSRDAEAEAAAPPMGADSELMMEGGTPATERSSQEPTPLTPLTAPTVAEGGTQGAPSSLQGHDAVTFDAVLAANAPDAAATDAVEVDAPTAVPEGFTVQFDMAALRQVCSYDVSPRVPLEASSPLLSPTLSRP
jgi:hypothetical protein